MESLKFGPISRTTATAAAGILVAVNLKYKWLPLTMEDTASVAGVLVFLTQIFQRQGMRKERQAVVREVATEAADVATSLAAEPSGWREAAAPVWDASPGWGEAPSSTAWGEERPNDNLAEIIRRLEALERR